MSDALQKVQSGQKLNIPAAAYNSFIDAAVDYRRRTIGHLFEAEDESQEWPVLHNAIRSTRKTYQADGTMPDWETLDKSLGELVDWLSRNSV